MHIDDLRDTEDMSLDLSAFCGASMSELMSQSLSNSGRPIVPLFKGCFIQDKSHRDLQ